MKCKSIACTLYTSNENHAFINLAEACNTIYKISMLARCCKTSGVRLYNSSIKAALKVPGPFTSSRAAATSAAMVYTSTLIPEKSAFSLYHLNLNGREI